VGDSEGFTDESKTVKNYLLVPEDIIPGFAISQMFCAVPNHLQ
jgi:hypothetical protein